MNLWVQIGELFARVSMGAILNSLWQGLLLAFVAWLCLRLVPRASASLRYAIWCIALVALLGLPLLAMYAAGAASGAADAAASAPAVAVPQRFAQVLFLAWYVSASVLIVRLILNYVKLQQLKASATPLPVLYQHRVRRWLAACGGRRACRVCVSDAVPMPVAIGLLDPVIILPQRLIDQLTDDEFDQIGLHEMAHLQRWDDYTNVFQKIVEALLFFNPAVYLIGRQLTLEREIACDDKVIAATGKPLTYALCLTRLVEATALARQPAHALGALSTRRQFAIRIERLLDRRGSMPAASRIAASLACIGIAASLVVAARLGSLIAIAPDNADQNARAVAPLSHVVQHIAHHHLTLRRPVVIAGTAAVHRISVAPSIEVRRIVAVARPNAVGARNFTTSETQIVSLATATAAAAEATAAANATTTAANEATAAANEATAAANQAAAAASATHLKKHPHMTIYIWKTSDAPDANATARAQELQLEALALQASHTDMEHQVAQIAQLDVHIANEVAQIAQQNLRISNQVKRLKWRLHVLAPRVAHVSSSDQSTVLIVNHAPMVVPADEAPIVIAIPQVSPALGADAVPEAAVISPAPTVPMPSARALQSMTEDASRLVEAYAQADSEHDKLMIVEQLAALPDSRIATDALIDALKDDSLVVKVFVIRALARHLDRAPERAALIDELRCSDSESVQLHIIAALTKALSDSQVRKALAETMLRDDAPGRVQAAAAQALAPVASDPEVHAAMLEAGGTGSDAVRAVVNHALAPHSGQ